MTLYEEWTKKERNEEINKTIMRTSKSKKCDVTEETREKRIERKCAHENHVKKLGEACGHGIT